MKIKVYVFESVEDAIAFERPEDKKATLEAASVRTEISTEEMPAAQDRPRSLAKKEKGERKCGYCRSADHRGKDCPKKPGTKRKVRVCSICGKPGHMAKTCPQTKPDVDI